MQRKFFQKGFTIIEVIIVIAIIGVLAGIVMTSVSSYQASSRNAQRKANLKQIASALTGYFSVNGAYPVVGAFRGVCKTGGYTLSGSNGYIPNLAPTYIGILPSDPMDGAVGSDKCYIYKSTDGQNYKISAHFLVEGAGNSSDPFFDRCGNMAGTDTQTYMVCGGPKAHTDPTCTNGTKCGSVANSDPCCW